MEQPRIFRYDTVDSTNTVCKSLAAQGAPSGTAVIARRQTAGRGRMGRSFESPEGLGLYLSVLWRPEGTPEDLLGCGICPMRSPPPGPSDASPAHRCGSNGPMTWCWRDGSWRAS